MTKRQSTDMRQWLVALIAIFAPWRMAAAEVLTTPGHVTVGIMNSVPPYVIENPSSGMDIDIIRAAFNELGATTTFIHVPLSRLDGLLADKLVNASVTVAPNPACAASKPFNHWHDGLVVAREFADAVKTPADLAGKRFAMFPKAATVLGPHLEGLDLQKEQPIIATEYYMALRLIIRGRVVAYLGDYWALDHLWVTLYGDELDKRPYVIAADFPPSPHALCFADRNLRDRFDTILARMKSDGRITAIIDSYRTPR
ncbi:substrate-binding periplasmic protein [Gimibacter soli]|uniref:Transporter substrate-binding domain-containing protein n=1 Tax=Gimibacter soli TaxID=3024400 RepID=A0AAE9XPJ6_9PROT|nr:transporter substrate-binding domain-containing protein [Gimibacter soli]WCL54833.1 transporter substrate-binding domain-containing protein [Gimibacter soli]